MEEGGEGEGEEEEEWEEEEEEEEEEESGADDRGRGGPPRVAISPSVILPTCAPEEEIVDAVRKGVESACSYGT